MKNILRLLILCVLLLPSWAQSFTTDGQEDVCANTAVIFCDNFEQGAIGSAKFKNPGWDVSDDTVSIVSTQAQDGTKSVQFAYDANAGAGYMDPASAFGSYRELYMRWYTKYSSNFVFSATNTKHAQFHDQDGQTSMHPMLYVFGAQPIFAMFSTTLVPTQKAYPNVGSYYPETVGVWNCYEAHIRLSSTYTATDGLLEGWINGTKYWYYPNQNLTGLNSGIPAMTNIKWSGYWNCSSGNLDAGGGHQPCDQNGDPNNSHPAMQRWTDNIVVSTQPIGCPLTGTPDTVAPSAPGSFAITAAGSATWTASTDNVGVTNYTLLFCTPSSCTPAQTVTTTTNLFATVTQTGDYAVWANDAAGNHSALSNIVAFTAPSVPVLDTSFINDDFNRTSLNPAWTKSGGNPEITGDYGDPFTWLEGGTYYLFVRNQTTGNLVVFTSTDLATWSGPTTMLSPGSAGAWDDYSIEGPYIVKVGSTYYLFYGGNINAGGSGTTWKVGYATALNIDGPYTKYAGNPILSRIGKGLNDVSVFYNASVSPSWQIIATSGSAGTKDDVGDGDFARFTASATDSTWTDQGNVLSLTAQDQSFTLDHSTLVMPYSPTGGQTVRQAVSSDLGATFTSVSTSALLSVGAPTTWDDAFVFAPHIIWNGTQYVMAYQGIDGAVSQIGIATNSRLHRWFPTAADAFEMPSAYLHSTTPAVLDWNVLRSEYSLAPPYVLESDIYFEGSPDATMTAGLHFANSSGLFYSVLFDAFSDAMRVYSAATVNATTTLVQENTSITFTTGTWYRVRATVTATGFRIDWYDGVNWTIGVLESTGLTLTPARIGPMSFSPAGHLSRWRNLTLAPAFDSPTIASLVSTATTATVTNGVGTASSYQLCSDSAVNPTGSCTNYTLAEAPGGVITRSLQPGASWECAYAVNNAGVATTTPDTAYKCNNVSAISPPIDTSPPVLSNPQPSATLAAGTTSAVYSVDLDKTINVSCRSNTTDPGGTDYTAYLSMANAMQIASLTASATVSGLTNGSTTNLYVRCNFVDVAGANHPNPTSTLVQVAVASSTPDTTPPSTVTGMTASVLSPNEITASWTAATPAGSKTITGYQVYYSTGSGSTGYVLAGLPVTTTTTIVNVPANSVINVVVKAIDSSGVFSAAYSNVATVTTPVVPDSQPPSTMTNLRVLNLFSQSATLTWDPGTDDQGSVFVTIEVCPHAESVCVESDFVTVVSKVALDYLVVSLAPSTTYTARGTFSDAAGNPSVAYSNLLEFTTLASGLPRPRLDVPFGSPRSSSGTPPSSGTRLPRP